jgi:hypothetical protein
MAERLFLAGKLTDLTDQRQLGRLNDVLSQLLAVYNSFDQNSFALAWIEGAAAGQVIASKGIGNAPEWDASPTITGATVTGLNASELVATNAGKQLVSLPIPGTSARLIGITADGAGVEIADGLKGYGQFPVAGTITGWSILADVAGDIVWDVWKTTPAGYPPTVANTITAAAKPTLAADDFTQSSAVGTWTTAVAANDVFGFNVDSCAGITRATLLIFISPT